MQTHPDTSFQSHLDSSFCKNQESSFCIDSLFTQSYIYMDKEFRLIYTPSSPARTLDATGIKDNFSTNTVSWLSGNSLGVCIGDRVYCYDYDRKKVKVLACLRKNQDMNVETVFCAISSQQNDHSFLDHSLNNINMNKMNDINNSGMNYCYGLSDGRIRIKQSTPTSNKGIDNIEIGNKWIYNKSCGAVTALSWKSNLIVAGYSNGTTLFINTKTGTITKSSIHNKPILLISHSPSSDLIAVSSSDRCVSIYNRGTSGIPIHLLRSKGEVRGMAWHGRRVNHLFTGSSYPECLIKLYDLNELKYRIRLEWKMDSGISGLIYKREGDLLYSCHGNISNADSDHIDINSIDIEREREVDVLDAANPNRIVCHSFKNADIDYISSTDINNNSEIEYGGVVGAHTSRILSCTFNEERNILVTVSSDENIKFWGI